MGLSTEILRNDLSGTFAMHSGAVTIDDYSLQLSEQKKHDEAAAARAIGNPESNLIDGDSRVLTAQKRVEMVKAEKKKTQEMALAAALEKQRQEMLDDLDRQIAGLRKDLADVDRKLATAEQRVANLSEIQLYLESSNFDPTNERFIELGRKQNFDTNRPQQEMLTDVKTELGVVKVDVASLSAEKIRIEGQISIREQAKVMLREASSDSELAATKEWMNKNKIPFSGKNKKGLIESVHRGNAKLDEEKSNVIDEIENVPTHKQVEYFEKMKAKLLQEKLSPEYFSEELNKIARTLSKDTQKELYSNPETAKILSNKEPFETNKHETLNSSVDQVTKAAALQQFDLGGLR